MNLNPAKTILLIVDMQKDFFGEGGNAIRRGKQVQQMQSLPKKINDFARDLREEGVKIVFTKFVYDPSRSPSNYTELTKATKASNWMCVKDSAGSELAGMEVKDSDEIIEKYSHDSFAGTELLQKMHGWGIETVIITGVRTEICVLSTACRSFAEGFSTIVISDLVGTYDDKSDISASIMNALEYVSFVLPAAEVMSVLKD